tara:strand:+ start:712 stop:987 length:276 start_codon:yes stop_codon:yes gene_type:complete
MKFHMEEIVRFLKKHRGNKFRGKEIDRHINQVTGNQDRYTQARAALCGATNNGGTPVRLTIAEKMGLVGSVKRTKDAYGVSVFQYVEVEDY